MRLAEIWIGLPSSCWCCSPTTNLPFTSEFDFASSQYPVLNSTITMMSGSESHEPHPGDHLMSEVYCTSTEACFHKSGGTERSRLKASKLKIQIVYMLLVRNQEDNEALNLNHTSAVL
jgi:hypothetical protein